MDAACLNFFMLAKINELLIFLPYGLTELPDIDKKQISGTVTPGLRVANRALQREWPMLHAAA